MTTFLLLDIMNSILDGIFVHFDISEEISVFGSNETSLVKLPQVVEQQLSDYSGMESREPSVRRRWVDVVDGGILDGGVEVVLPGAKGAGGKFRIIFILMRNHKLMKLVLISMNIDT